MLHFSVPPACLIADTHVSQRYGPVSSGGMVWGPLGRVRRCHVCSLTSHSLPAADRLPYCPRPSPPFAVVHIVDAVLLPLVLPTPEEPTAETPIE